VRGLTLSVDATTGAVSLFGTTGASGATAASSALYGFTDLTGYNGAISGTAASLTTGTLNEAFRGVAYVPGTTVNVTYVAVPEPHTVGLAIAGMLGVVVLMRRRKAAFMGA
jgi:hypothetical protein